MIRASTHTLKFTNKAKLETYADFVAEYRRVGCLIIDSIWKTGYKAFDFSRDKLEFPKYIDYKDFGFETALSARALSSLVTQVSSVIRGAVEIKRKTLWKLEKIKEERKSVRLVKKRLHKIKISKPDFSLASPELSSKCIDFQKGKEFEWFIRIKAVGSNFGHIKIPVRATKVYNKWNEKGKLLGGVSLSDNSISLRFDVVDRYKTVGDVVGADQGIVDVITLSSGNVAGKIDNHGHSLNSITKKLTRKRKGSKAFRKTQQHRKNHINWSINQIDFSEIKEIRLEKIWNIGYKKSKSRYLSHFTNTLIRDKVKRKAQEEEVLVVEQDCTYRSQRCSKCGLVRKANRKGKAYACSSCGYSADADLNAAINHTVELPPITYTFRSQRNNLGKGFFWKPEGLFTFDGVELRVPLSKN